MNPNKYRFFNCSNSTYALFLYCFQTARVRIQIGEADGSARVSANCELCQSIATDSRDQAPAETMMLDALG